MTTPERKSLSREDWIQAAQKALVDGGIDAVRIDSLAKGLKITRGSFYYHFKSRDELLDGVLSSWRIRATEAVINQLRTSQSLPSDQLIQLLELPHHGKTAREAQAIELGIRVWARRDKRARAAIDEVDNHRLRYIKGLMEQIGVGASEASDRAYLLYSYQVSLSLINLDMTPAERTDRHARISGLLIPKVG